MRNVIPQDEFKQRRRLLLERQQVGASLKASETFEVELLHEAEGAGDPA